MAARLLSPSLQALSCLGARSPTSTVVSNGGKIAEDCFRSRFWSSAFACCSVGAITGIRPLRALCRLFGLRCQLTTTMYLVLLAKGWHHRRYVGECLVCLCAADAAPRTVAGAPDPCRRLPDALPRRPRAPSLRCDFHEASWSRIENRAITQVKRGLGCRRTTSALW
jgi:hypothetical protein